MDSKHRAMAEEEVKLLNLWASPFGMRVRLALGLKGIKYEYIEEEDLHSSKSPLLLQMNPIHKKVPVLIHNGKPIGESLIILHYLDEAWPQTAPLLPSDPYQRSRARFWADFIDKKVYNDAMNMRAAKGEEREKAVQEYINTLKRLEEELGEKAYFGGDSIGYVDVALVPFYQWFYTHEKVGNFSIEANCPKLAEWGKRCLQDETISKCLPDPQKLYDFFLDLMKCLGLD